jgi:hypothetical protein
VRYVIMAASALLAFDLLWIVGYVFLRLFVDIPFGPVNVWARGQDFQESVQRNIQSQHRLLAFWRKQMAVVAAVCLVVALGLLIAAG